MLHDMIYLNQAGTSWPKPAAVRNAVQLAMEEPPERWERNLDARHRRVCRALGVGDPSRLLLTPGATSALSIAITDHPWKRGDRLLLSSMEHHAVHGPAQRLRERGVDVSLIPRGPGNGTAGPTSGSPEMERASCFDLEELRVRLSHGNVRMVAVTMASNVTGELLPIDSIAALTRAHGALLLLDAAQVAGWWPLDLDQIGADLVVLTGHKGLQAPWGIGALYVRPEVRMSCPTAQCTVPLGPPEDRNPGPAASLPGHCDVGSIDRLALAGLAAACEWLDAPARRDRLQSARGRLERITRVAETYPHVAVLGARDSSLRMPTVALTVANTSPTALATALLEHGVIASAGLQCAPSAHHALGTSPSGVLRLSTGPSNSDDEISRAEHALHVVLRSTIDKAP